MNSSFQEIDGWNASVTLKGDPPLEVGGIARVDVERDYVFTIETPQGERIPIKLAQIKRMNFWAPGEGDDEEIEVSEERIYR